jgi:hypothetical protein
VCRDNSIIWFLLLILIFFRCNRVSGSRPLNFDTFFKLDSSAPFYPGIGVL